MEDRFTVPRSIAAASDKSQTVMPAVLTALTPLMLSSIAVENDEIGLGHRGLLVPTNRPAYLSTQAPFGN
jgi:hypothetical protein